MLAGFQVSWVGCDGGVVTESQGAAAVPSLAQTGKLQCQCSPLRHSPEQPRTGGAPQQAPRPFKIGRTSTDLALTMKSDGTQTNGMDHSLSRLVKLARRPRGRRAAFDGVAVSLCWVAYPQSYAHPVVVERVADLADLSPRGAVGDDPESVPHGLVLACVRACFEKSTILSVLPAANAFCWPSSRSWLLRDYGDSGPEARREATRVRSSQSRLANSGAHGPASLGGSEAALI